MSYLFDAPQKGKIPTISGYKKFNNFLKNPFSAYAEALKEHRMFCFRFAHLSRIFISEPDLIQHVLHKNQSNYYKSKDYQSMYPVIGSGLLVSDGDFWKKRRRLLAPAFCHKKMRKVFEIMKQESLDVIKKWDNRAKGQSFFNVSPDMMELSLKIIVRSLFGGDVSQYVSKIDQAWSRIQEDLNLRITSIIRSPYWVPTHFNVRFKSNIKILDEIIYRIIESRRNSNESHEDLLDLLMTVVDEETGEILNSKHIRDELMTQFLAGHETTSNAFSWTLFLLSQHPEVVERMREEFDRVLGNNEVSFETVAKLKYTEQVINESMRIYPPVWIIARESINEDQLGGYTIPPQSVILMSQYVMNRDPLYWDNPEVFNPDNFSPEKVKNRHKYLFLPFGGGARICIGNRFSMFEMVTFLSLALRKFNLVIDKNHVVEPQPQVTLFPKNGIRIAVHKIR